MYEKIILLFIIINIPIVFFYKYLVNLINIYDYGDGIRKLQKRPIALIGGFILIYNLSIFFIINTFTILNFYQYFFYTKEYFTFYVGTISFFLVGVYDDKYQLSAAKKLLINFFLIIFLILIDKNLVIYELKFTFMKDTIQLMNFSYFFSVLCFLLLINALNMFDGINLQSGIFCIIIFTILLVKNLYTGICFSIILSLILFLYYNYKNKGFLGDSGIQVLAFIISYILIKSYNNTEDVIAIEEIFVLLSFPGLDMLRLFIIRILNGKNPFKADRNHMHHLISDKINKNFAIIIIQITIISNILFYYFVLNKIIVIFFVISVYLFLYLCFKKTKEQFEKNI
tara:strand:+ start:119 stop:1141 length:1023 start_codon:yes stop_codon:yes gene_type:complete